MEIRRVTNKELRLLMDLYLYAYNELLDQPVTEEVLDELVPHEILGLFEDGNLVSSLRVHDFLQSIRGVVKECGGVAGVATYPEARRKGYVRKLMLAGFHQMYEQGQSVSALDPFKESFYAKFGYVASNAPYLVKAPLKKLNSLTPKDSKWTFERGLAVNEKNEYLEFVRDVGLNQYHGYITYKTLTDGMWARRVKNSFIVFVKYEGKTQALGRYRIKGGQQKDGGRATMTVIDHLWRTPEARMMLFYFFLQHQDQIHDIIFHAPFETEVQHWFTNTRLSVEQKAPWMVRVVNAPKAVENLPAAGEDIITLDLSDSECPWNNAVFTLKSEKNRLRMTKTSGKPIVKLSIKAFSALVFGTLTLDELEFQGEINISESWARHALKRWFPKLALYNVVYF